MATPISPYIRHREVVKMREDETAEIAEIADFAESGIREIQEFHVYSCFLFKSYRTDLQQLMLLCIFFTDKISRP